jgi:hypothetical protein
MISDEDLRPLGRCDCTIAARTARKRAAGAEQRSLRELRAVGALSVGARHENAVRNF